MFTIKRHARHFILVNCSVSSGTVLHREKTGVDGSCLPSFGRISICQAIGDLLVHTKRFDGDLGAMKAWVGREQNGGYDMKEKERRNAQDSSL